MSVQAPQLPSLGGEHKSRPTQFATTNPGMGGNIDSRAFIFPTSFNNGTPMAECQQQVFLGGASVDNMPRAIPRGTSAIPPFQGLVLPNFTHVYQQPAPAMAAESTPTTTPTMGARKRCKESVYWRMQSQQAHPQLGVDLNQTHAGGTLVSTGLRLAFDDEHSTITSSRPSPTNASATSLTLRDEVAVHFSMHQEDLNQLLKSQAEQLRQALEEQTRTQTKALMASIEAEVSRKMREKEVEMERVSRRNAELEERVRQLSMEREVWQGKAKSSEAMVVILRNNLQQAMVQVQQQQQHQQGREPSRAEGCGDSEVDDAASVYIDDNPPAQQSRALMMRNALMRPSHMSGGSSSDAPGVVMSRACRRCGASEACVLLLPCLHLCVCAQCNQSNSTDRCPVCSSLVSNSAEVYLS